MIKCNDVLVVGSGAGGATIAHELAKKGRSVSIFEAGPEVSGAYLGDFKRVVFWPGYYSKLVIFSKSVEGTSIYRTLNTGGSTVFSCGNMVRSLQQEFLNLGIDLEECFKEAEADLNVTQLSSAKIITGSRLIFNCTQNTDYSFDSMPKGAMKPGAYDALCNSCGNCVLGCKKQVKWDARYYIARAKALGSVLHAGVQVRQVIFSDKGKVNGVLTNKGFYKADTVILSAGALATPVILQKSGIPAGQGLFIDPFNVTYGVLKGASQHKGVSMSAILSSFHQNDGFILSPYIDHWSDLFLLAPKSWLVRNKFSKKQLIGIMNKITDERTGSVDVDGKIHKKLTGQDLLRLNAGNKVARKIISKTGAEDIITISKPRGAHPGGTAALNEIVDKNFKVKGYENLFVCDASLFPKAPGKPPILTIVALAKWLGKHL